MRRVGKSSPQGLGRMAALHGQLLPLLPKTAAATLPLERAEPAATCRAEPGTAVHKKRAVTASAGLEHSKEDFRQVSL